MKSSSPTRVFALLGNPVSHSLSPAMQNAAFRAAGLDATYITLRPEPEMIPAVMRTLIRGGGGGNITVPFKELAATVPAGRDARVERLSASNVFGVAGEEMELGNTDVDGILAALQRLDAPAGPWLVIGTGGSARAVVGAAMESGMGVAVRSRDPSRARAFGEWATSIGASLATVADCRVVINATPLGLSASDQHPLAVDAIPSGAAVLDLVYGQDGPTPWVRACNARGLAAIDGREVLLAQGAASWHFWFPGVAPPIEVMRAALHGRLG